MVIIDGEENNIWPNDSYSSLQNTYVKLLEAMSDIEARFTDSQTYSTQLHQSLWPLRSTGSRLVVELRTIVKARNFRDGFLRE